MKVVGFVLNLVINGIPSIQVKTYFEMIGVMQEVLNLVINGIPSILIRKTISVSTYQKCFKPCYKWNTFNTREIENLQNQISEVLNLIINGIPSILSAQNF